MSGLSSGGYMAVQVHVAHSSRVKGVGALAAGPYYCAQGSLWTAMSNCMTPGTWTPVPPASLLSLETQQLAGSGAIDPPANLAKARVWLFSGGNDRTVLPEVVQATKRFYEAFKAAPELVVDKPAGHAMVTEDAGNACPTTAPPFINDCDYDAAGALLQHLLGPLKPRGEAGAPREFDQRPFAAPGLHDTGYVYVPAECASAPCRIHVAFHGCRQTAGQFAQGAGYNRWAEANRLIVLYPQARESWWPFNPRGCWDWWGYSGALYHTRQGPQVRAVMAMVERLGAAPRR